MNWQDTVIKDIQSEIGWSLEIFAGVDYNVNKLLNRQAEIAFKVGIREGIRRACEDMKRRGSISDYNLDRFVEYLEEKEQQ